MKPPLGIGNTNYNKYKKLAENSPLEIRRLGLTCWKFTGGQYSTKPLKKLTISSFCFLLRYLQILLRNKKATKLNEAKTDPTIAMGITVYVMLSTGGSLVVTMLSRVLVFVGDAGSGVVTDLTPANGN